MPPNSGNKPSVLITGANRGIGYETAKQLAAKNWHVIATSRSDAFPTEQRDTLLALNPQTQFIRLDISDPESIQAATDTFQSTQTSLDLLINNAGIFLDHDTSILEVTEADLTRSFNTNTLGPLRLTRALLPFLKRSPRALVINLSSAAGSLTDMKDWSPAYSTSKTALNAITRQLAAALAPENIAVCALSPGWVQTDMGGKEAPRSVAEAARKIIELLDTDPAELSARFIRDGGDHPW